MSRPDDAIEVPDLPLAERGCALRDANGWTLARTELRWVAAVANVHEPMRKALAFVQWGIGGCVACGGVKSTGHEADCKVAAALRAADGATEDGR